MGQYRAMHLCFVGATSSKFQSLAKVQPETLECTLDDLLIAPTDPMWLKRAGGKD